MKWLIVLTVVSGFFWNVENFFDWEAQTDGKSDVEFSACGKRGWTRGRFYRKCDAVAKTVLAASELPVLRGDAPGVRPEPPDFIALAEVENDLVVSRLARTTPLSKLGYSFIHYDSFDHRGIDCALLYRSETVRLISSKPCRIFEDDGSPMATRDILLAVLMKGNDTLAVLVNHHPSKVGASGARGRARVMKRLTGLCDSLRNAGVRHMIAVGDFNDDIRGNPDLWAGLSLAGEDFGAERGDVPGGTIKYNGAWEKIDGCLYDGVGVEEKIFAFAPLLTADPAFGGMKPLRTYSGPRYMGGVSDHLPLVLRISF